ncbi:MAG: hypothetical protein Tsb0013_17240 [Phycisphaerales bacterium]
MTVVHTEPETFACGLAVLSGDAACEDPRVEWFVGPDAIDRWRRVLEARVACKAPGGVIGATSVVGTLSDALAELRARQSRDADRMSAMTAGRSAGRGVSFWAERYREAMLPGSSAPLRVLVVSCRYSTFVRHSARDIASAIRRAGHDAEIIEEPTPHDRITSLSVLEPFERLDPDLVLLINYTRLDLPGVRDANVPTVCWQQDRLVHLYDKRVGAAQRATDFLIGHMQQSLFDLHGWDRGNAIFSAVPACAEVFHRGPIDPALEREMSCDIAYIGNQSASVDEEHARLAEGIAGDPGLRALLDRATERIKHIVSEGDPDRRRRRGVPSYIPPASLTRDLLREAGMVDPPPDLVDRLQALHIAVIAERAYRHARLEWAASIAERHGLRMRLYGRGWDRHPVLAKYAAGELEHGEQLRAAYRGEKLHLHVSLNTNAHQRVAECALSGGVMARCAPSPDARWIHINLLRTLVRDHTPTRTARNGDLWFTLEPAEHPSMPCPRRLRRTRYMPEPDRPADDTITLCAPREWIDHDFFGVPELPLEQFPDYAFSSAHETMFWTREDLEGMVLRAVGDPAWREQTATAHARAACAGMTYDRTIARLFEHMTTVLGERASRSAGAA